MRHSICYVCISLYHFLWGTFSTCQELCDHLSQLGPRLCLLVVLSTVRQGLFVTLWKTVDKTGEENFIRGNAAWDCLHGLTPSADIFRGVTTTWPASHSPNSSCVIPVLSVLYTMQRLGQTLLKSSSVMRVTLSWSVYSITERRDVILASPVFSKSMLVPTLYPAYKVITNHPSDSQSSIQCSSIIIQNMIVLLGLTSIIRLYFQSHFFLTVDNSDIVDFQPYYIFLFYLIKYKLNSTEMFFKDEISNHLPYFEITFHTMNQKRTIYQSRCLFMTLFSRTTCLLLILASFLALLSRCLWLPIPRVYSAVEPLPYVLNHRITLGCLLPPVWVLS